MVAPAYIILAGPRLGVASAIRAGIMGVCNPHVDDLIDTIGHPAVTMAAMP